ncbi:MAG: hypothetical protein H6624_15590 [Bdellovibrionaceae bacterium]|nr:hypothetical protein [Pseudobdellovibrionaceae bacterium]
MLKTTTENGKPINQWLALNKILFVYKLVGGVLALLCLILGIMAFMLAMADPVVVLKNADEQVYFTGHRRPVQVTKANIKTLVEEYIRLRYEWDTLDPRQIALNTSPLVTDGFKQKTFAFLLNLKEKQIQGKAAKQGISSVKVEVTDSATTASFDRILRVEGLPLIIPTQVSFTLVKGSTTRWNPMGLYINATTVHEGQ